MLVELGGLAPADVDVQVVHGRPGRGTDELSDVASLSLTHRAAHDDGTHEYSGDLRLERTGDFGYTVRVLPTHEGLAFQASLGLVANA